MPAPPSAPRGIAAGEACFTTAMAGYEEAASDPSYMAQVLAFSYPLVGNYGVDSSRLESDGVCAEAIVMRMARPAWAHWLAEQGVVALETSTRARSSVRFATAAHFAARSVRRRKKICTRAHLPNRRSTAVRSTARSGPGSRIASAQARASPSSTSAQNVRFPRRLARAASRSMVVPGHWDAAAILETSPRAVLVSNGPGDPAVFDGPIETVRELLGQVPLFGICLGHQILGLALGLDDVQAAVRTPRCQPSGSRPADGPRARDRAEPRLRGRRQR